MLDLYSHPRCVYTDVESVRKYVEPYGIELVVGDISTTFRQLMGMPLALVFCDTDNYTPVREALDLCADQLLPGGAIVLDHFTTTADYLNTLGERIAAQESLGSRADFHHLHGTGVFTKLATPAGTESH